MKVMLDTCVVLDYLQGREPFFDDALNVFIAIANDEIHGFITASSVTDIYYIIQRCTHKHERSKEILNNLIKLISILDTTSEDCINALVSRVKDYEDAVMIESSRRAKIDYIVTRNTRDYEKSSVRVVSPLELLDAIS